VISSSSSSSSWAVVFFFFFFIYFPPPPPHPASWLLDLFFLLHTACGDHFNFNKFFFSVIASGNVA
jgi:hypothetical protein